MFNSNPSTFPNDVLKPETREELHRRLAKQPQSNPAANSSPGNSGQPAAGTNWSSSLVSPLRREDLRSTSPSTSPAREELAPDSNSDLSTTQSPASFWATRQGKTGLGIAAAGLLGLWLWLILTNEGPPETKPLDDQSVAASAENPSKNNGAFADHISDEDAVVAPAVNASQNLALTGRTLVTVHEWEQKSKLGSYQVLSHPSGAQIFSEGKATGYTTSATLPDYFEKEHLTVELAGHRVKHKVIERSQGQDVVMFDLEQVAINPLKIDLPLPIRVTEPEPTTLADYGLELDPDQQNSLNAIVEKLLNQEWKASPEVAKRNANIEVAVWEKFANHDPRLYHAHGILLWHHLKYQDAIDEMQSAVERERTRLGQRVPYFPLYRDMIRLRSVMKEEEEAAEDLLDLARDTARTLKKHPQAGLHEAQKNAQFAGNLLAFLEGPSKGKLTGAINPRRLGEEIEQAFPTLDLRETFATARSDGHHKFQDQLTELAGKQKSHDDKEQALRKTGELGRKDIRSFDQRNNGRHSRSDHNAQNVTPFRIPYSPHVYATNAGVVGYAHPYSFTYGSHGHQNLLFSSSPSISKSYFNNRTIDTTTLLRKVVLEDRTKSFWRGHTSLTTYMPERLERKRREILASLTEPTDE